MIGTFYINNQDVYLKWGIVFRKGVFAELLKAPKRKKGFAFVWEDAHGTERDDSPFFESLTYNLQMVIIAENEGDFWTKYNSFYDFILTSGYFTLRSAELNKEFTLLYDDMSKFINLTHIATSSRVGADFTLVLINDFTGTNVGGKPAPSSPTVTVKFATAPTSATSTFTNLKYEKHSMIHFEWDDASRGALIALGIFAGKTFTDGAGNTKKYALAVAVNGKAQFDNREVGQHTDLGITYAEGLQIINAGGDIENHSMYHDPTGNYNNGSNALLNVQQLEQLYYERTGYRMNALVVPTNYAGFMQAAFDEGYVAASSESTFDSFTAQPTGFGATGVVGDIPAGFIAFDRQFTDDWAARLADFKSYIDELLTGTSATVNRWFRIGSHNLTDQISFNELIDYLQTQASDRIWVTTMREFAEYRVTKAETVKTEDLVGDTLTITLDQSAISDRVRWRDLTLKINSDAAIESVTVAGVDGSSYNAAAKLINVFKQKLTFALDNQGSGGDTYTLEQTILINFANEFYPGSQSGSNNFIPSVAQSTTLDGYSLSNLVNTSNAATDVDIAIGAPFGGAANSTAAATGEVQIYPDLMVNSGLIVTDSGADGTLVVSGLDNSKFYHFYILGSSNVANTSTKWTIGAANETKVTTDNYPLTSAGDKYTNPAIVRILNIQPTGGVITIAARKMGSAWENIGFSVLEIERSNIAKV